MTDQFGDLCSTHPQKSAFFYTFVSFHYVGTPSGIYTGEFPGIPRFIFSVIFRLAGCNRDWLTSASDDVSPVYEKREISGRFCALFGHQLFFHRSECAFFSLIYLLGFGFFFR